MYASMPTCALLLTPCSKLSSDLQAVESIIDTLLYVTPNRNLLYVTDVSSGVPSFKFEHLSCFLPGMLALGVHTLDLPLATKELHTWAAEGIATTCWLTYADQASGLGPDEMSMTRPVGSWTTGKWTTLLEEWEAAGRPGGVPPGLGRTSKPEHTAAARDYRADKTTYLLRPEVHICSLPRLVNQVLKYPSSGGREFLHSLADDGGPRMARAWVVGGASIK